MSELDPELWFGRRTVSASLSELDLSGASAAEGTPVVGKSELHALAANVGVEPRILAAVMLDRQVDGLVDGDLMAVPGPSTLDTRQQRNARLLEVLGERVAQHPNIAGMLLREHREHLGLSQDNLAALMRWPAGAKTISRWETKGLKTSDHKRVIALVDTLELSPGHFLNELSRRSGTSHAMSKSACAEAACSGEYEINELTWLRWQDQELTDPDAYVELQRGRLVLALGDRGRLHGLAAATLRISVPDRDIDCRLAVADHISDGRLLMTDTGRVLTFKSSLFYRYVVAEPDRGKPNDEFLAHNPNNADTRKFRWRLAEQADGTFSGWYWSQRPSRKHKVAGKEPRADLPAELARQRSIARAVIKRKQMG